MAHSTRSQNQDSHRNPSSGWDSDAPAFPPPQGEAIGEAEAFLEFQANISRVAKVDRPVLIVGERGSGKELAVKRLHFLSRRWKGPLVALNCAALSPGVLESELFGHETGAFTGAGRQRIGRFETAHGGTLFLDEIGLIPINVQEKILRVVEYGQFERVGGSDPVSVNVRILGATNADLPALAEENRFKRDLLDRLSFEVLFIPPLRRRREDILLLARHFATRMATELGNRELIEFSPAAEKALEAYPWPGNIRELKNVVERAVYRSEKAVIHQIDFDPFNAPWPSSPDKFSGWEENPPPAESTDLIKEVRDLEIRRMRSALQSNQFHQSKAAGALGLSYHQFRGLYRKYRRALGAIGRAPSR